MKEAGFTTIRKSITNRQNTVAQYIATRPHLDLCEQATQRGGGEGVQAVVGPEGNCLGNGEGTVSRDRFRFGIGNGVGSGGRGTSRAGRKGGGETHIQWGERIKWRGMERRKCRPLGMIVQNSEIIHNARA